ncbi:MAG: hypothetical protein AAF485_20830 [Chloroflexota bacterium]
MASLPERSMSPAEKIIANRFEIANLETDLLGQGEMARCIALQIPKQLKFEMGHFTEFALVVNNETVYLPIMLK